MTVSPSAKRAEFRRLHESGCFVLPNPWDAGGVRVLEQLGAKALASTSAGFAWSIGKPDGAVTLEEMLAHLTALAAMTELPVNADFEHGYADAPDAVAKNVTRAVATGVAGLSIEDSTGRPDRPLYDFAHAVERVKAARAAIDAGGTGTLLTARSEGFFVGRPDLDETVKRLKAFAEAGADCLYAPGLPDHAAIGAALKAVAPKPVNVLAAGPGFKVAELAALGVRRVSVGGALARAAWGGF
ncbi:MAG TPA: isocitrate lyase/phosphoenolpyruvate mutase family protein, partial [Candidatus Sulfotelmatobacter sp.]|nr:isocitrate lyase/phosphoenolpyruvate mutase family protein [Candidatus Sulfotelmatobacter sp.]